MAISIKDIQITLQPENLDLGELGLGQRLSFLTNHVDCTGNMLVRGKHSINIRNNTYQYKYSIDVDYKTDEPDVRMCGNEQPNLCDGGKSTRSIKLHKPQKYWQGGQKDLVRFFCWKPSAGQPDINVIVNFKSRTFGTGRSPHELNHTENILVAHAKLIGETNSG